MERWLKITESDHGEWSVVDLERNYRVCAFNHRAHGGSHVHHKTVTRAIDLDSLHDATQVVRAYAAAHDELDLGAFEEVLNEWKSEPSSD